MLLHELRKTQAVVGLGELLPWTVKSGLFAAQGVVAEEVNDVQGPLKVDISAMRALEEWLRGGRHVAHALRVVEGPAVGMLEAEREGAENQLDQGKKLITRLWWTVAAAGGLGSAREHDFHQVGALDEVLQGGDVAASWLVGSADNGSGFYKGISDTTRWKIGEV